MKKAAALLLVFSLVFCLFSCSADGNNGFTTELTEKLAQTVSSTLENTTDEDQSFYTGFCQTEPNDTSNIYATQNHNHEGLSGTPTVAAVTAADFGFKMLRNTLNQQTNALISPVSILSALGMTANGAKGKTLEEMESVLGTSVETLNKNFHADRFSGDGVNTANSIWFKNAAKNDLTLNDTFVNTVQDAYGAEWYGKKFDKSTVGDINRWVSQHTDGMINNMLSEIPPEAVIYLINTVMFDAEWEYPYSKSDVHENRVFTAENGKEQKVTMLTHRTNTWMKFGLGKAQGIVKRYKNGYSLAAILPLEGVSINAALASFTGSDFVKAVTPTAIDPTCGTGLYPVDVSLPKFETECKFRLSDTLIGMGMPTAFSAKEADFSGIGKSHIGNIFIGEVYHNTYIKLDELGTKAGAATAVEAAAAGFAEEPFGLTTMEFNRPFIYVIYETDSGTPLFMGTVRKF